MSIAKQIVEAIGIDFTKMQDDIEEGQHEIVIRLDRMGKTLRDIHGVLKDIRDSLERPSA